MSEFCKVRGRYDRKEQLQRFISGRVSMLKTGPAFRVIIHLNADIGSQDDFLHNDVIAFLHAHDVAGATVFRPYAGFGLHHRLHRKGAPGIEGEHLPIRIDFVEHKEKVESLLPALFDLVTDGMIEVQETTVVKIAGSIFNPRPGDGLSE